MQVSNTPPAAATPSAAQTNRNTRAADGDYKVRNAATSQVKDADGDYKPASKSPAAGSSSGVQAALNGLKLGG